MPRSANVWVDEASVAISRLTPSGQPINLTRKPDEPIDACLRRAAASVWKAESKQSRAAKSKDEATATLQDSHGAMVPPGTRNDAAWHNGGVLSIVLPGGSGAAAWTVLLNAPYVHSLQVPELPLVGQPVIALAELRFAAGASWAWQSDGCPDQILSRTNTYTPTAAEVGCTLRVSVTPSEPHFAHSRLPWCHSLPA